MIADRGARAFYEGPLATRIASAILERFPIREVTVRATKPDGRVTTFAVTVRVDTPKEWEYMQHGGILQFVLRELAG